MDYCDAKAKYHAQTAVIYRKRRKDRNGAQIEMKFTFEEWAEVWKQSGKWELRGIRKGSYCMARHNDIGHYEVGNVSIILSAENTRQGNCKENQSEKKRKAASKQGKSNKGRKHTPEARAKISEAQIGGKRSLTTREKMSKSATGVKCSDETKEKLSKINKGRPMNRVNCGFCGLETSPQNLSRHVAQCKLAK